MSSPPSTLGGRRMMARLCCGTPERCCREPSERFASRPEGPGLLELAARPSHYAHFCALSRYGVTTELVVPHLATGSVASGMLANATLRDSKAVDSLGR